jgi:plasmid stability protein
MSGVATLYLRDVPEALYRSLKRRARRNRRSMNAEAIAILQQALDGDLAEDDLMERFRSVQYTVPEGELTGAEIIRMFRDGRAPRSRR